MAWSKAKRSLAILPFTRLSVWVNLREVLPKPRGFLMVEVFLFN
jgi:hypothetical protein